MANTLSTARVSEVAPTRLAARAAGRELARIHLAGAPAFGAPPPEWAGPNYIGTRQQECTPTDHWGRFYTAQRVLPFARRAHEVGNLEAQGLAVVEQAATAIADATWDVAPARIHGDLWTGNLLFGDTGPVFIDPVSHGGHPGPWWQQRVRRAACSPEVGYRVLSRKLFEPPHSRSGTCGAGRGPPSPKWAGFRRRAQPAGEGKPDRS